MERAVAFSIRLTVVISGYIIDKVEPRNKRAERVFMRRILAYSARKKSAKGPPAYSTLKPDTSSDSPSVRSKGARFVSAREEMYHMAARGQAGIISHVASCVVLKTCKVNPPEKIMTHRRIRPKLTSYEMVWATARRAPMRAYFEFEAQPAPKIVYTARLDKARMNKMLRLRSAKEWGRGIGVQRVKASIRAIVGASKKRMGEEVEGRTGSFMKSFSPSAIG